MIRTGPTCGGGSPARRVAPDAISTVDPDTRLQDQSRPQDGFKVRIVIEPRHGPTITVTSVDVLADESPSAQPAPAVFSEPGHCLTTGTLTRSPRTRHLQREHRQYATDPVFKHDYYRAHRPMVKRSTAWPTRGNRLVPHRGVAQNNDWLNLGIAGLNLQRLLALGLSLNEGSGVLG